MTDTSSSPLSLVAQYAPLASSVSRQFEGRPSLRSVARDLVNQVLSERTPPLPVDGASLKLVRPDTADPITLEDLLIQRYLQGRTLNLIADHDHVTVQRGLAAPSRLALGIGELEALIHQYGPRLLDHYKQRLVEYWNHVDAKGQSRWQWLASHLREHVRTLAHRQTEQGRLDGEESEMLLAVCSGAPLPGTRTALLQIQVIANRAVTTPHITSDLVITRTPENGELERVLLCRPLAEVQAFADMASLAAAQADYLGNRLTGQRVDFALVDVDVDSFDAQAMLILEHQLSNLTDLAEHYRQQGCDIDSLVGLVERITSLYDLSQPEEQARTKRMAEALPTWLEQAPRDDRLRYATLLARLGEVQRLSGGRHYLDGIQSLDAYAATELNRQIALDHPEQTVALADVEVRIYQAPNALLEVAHAGDGQLEYAVISLVELALYNLHGRPAGMLEIEPHAGATLPSWVTREAVSALVSKVDIGRRYVALLRQRLLDDGADAARRQQLYLDQLRVQLPLKMLELKIRQACGVTAAGVGMLMQALQPDPVTARRAGSGASTPTVRQLALCRAPGATPDIIQCAYLIGAPDDGAGTCVLYRPLSREPLRQFVDAQALLSAIKAPGALQDEVLQWLDAAARPIYANGGFDEPHIRHFLPGDDATELTPPAPATLTGLAIDGEVWAAFYRHNVAGLQAIADRQSVSNEESRWLGFRELGWVVFNALLPMVGGPLATAGWMLQSLKIFADGFDARLHGDPQAASTALMEFFFNAAFVLFGHSLEGRSKGVDRVTRPLLQGGEWHDPVEGLWEPVPVSAESVVSRIVVQAEDAQASHPAALHELDFGFQSASRQLSTAQQQALKTFAVAAADFGSPVPHGPLQGLYLLHEQLYGLIDGTWFALVLEDGAPQIMDRRDASRRGPYIRRDEAGRWLVDTGLRLLGGAPGGRRKAYLLAQQQREAQLLKTVDDYRQKQLEIDRRLKLAQSLMASLQEQHSSRYPKLRQEFITVASEMIAASGDAVDAFSELNKIKPVPRFLEERTSHLRSLLRIKWEIVSKLREQLSELILGDGLGREAPAEDPMSTFEEFAQGCDLIDRLTHWTGEAQRRMHELAAIEHLGPPALAAIMPTWANFGTPLTWRGVQLYWLAILCEEKLLARPRQDSPLVEAAASAKLATQAQHEILEPGLFTDQEQMQVLDSALQRYEILEDTLDFIQSGLEPGRLSPAMARLSVQLGELRKAADEQLIPLFRQQTLRARQQRKQQRPARQQVIVTSRKRGVLVGRIKAQSDGHPQRLEVAGGLDNGALIEFEQVAGGDDWERVAPAATPVAPQPVAPFEASMREAQVLLGRADAQLLQAQGRIQAGKTHIPSETQNLLDAAAEELRDKADIIDQVLIADNQTDRLSSSTGQSAEVTIKQLRDKAQLLKTEGRRLRIQLCKAGDPQASRVQWLVEEGEARIEREGPRKLLKGGDYLQEYAVRDDAAVLWYAHFHYPKMTTAADGFSVAHLKTVAQRFMTYKDYMASGDTAKGAKGIIRAEIQPNMARKLYLSVGVEETQQRH
jgi:hypothetical protein